MATKAEIKAQLDELTKAYNAAPDDDDLELEVEHEGVRTRLKGAHARALLKRFGIADDDPGDEGGGEGESGGDGGDGDDPGDRDPEPPSGHRFFRGK